MLFKSRGKDIISAEELNQFKADLSVMRYDIDEHLQAINGNTNEIDVQNSFICEIDSRITKMEEKVDDLHFLLKQLVNKTKMSVDLSKDEQRVFLILYTHEKFMKSENLAEKVQLSRSITEEVLTSMLDKGIPLDREILDGTVYFRMNKEFKLRQAKENIIKIDPDVTSQFQNTLLEQFFGD